MYRVLVLPVLIALLAITRADAPPIRSDVLFDFESVGDVEVWSNLSLPGAGEKEPPVSLARVAKNATSGKHSLKLTFAGGRWPTVTTTRIPGDWTAYQTFEADVTVSRTCVVGFTVLQEKSTRGSSWEALISRWTKTAFLQPGKNHVRATIPQPNRYAIDPRWGKVVRFEIFMYAPRMGESIWVDNIRLTTAKLPTKAPIQFKVAATDWVVSGTTSAQAVIELGKKLKGRWKPPKRNTIEQVEAAFRKRYQELKEKHPKAELALLRDGVKGYDPARPDRVFAGWKDAYFNSHGPDGNYVERAANRGKSASHEVFMRHRSPLMRVDLSSIPEGATILTAQLVIVRAGEKYQGEHNPEKKPTLWVVEPCNRPWEEYEVNALEYAKDKFWKQIGGMDWNEDGDFRPVFLAYGPGQGKVSTWDFTEAVRWWTSGKHANHGFMLHGDSNDYMIAHAREAKEIKDRPGVWVVYEEN
jgi:hypothetical protein